VGRGKARIPSSRASELEAEHGPLPPLEPEALALHSRFMTMLLDLLQGNLESGQYEDNVRALLGMASSWGTPASMLKM
jgi:hypothetical protein